MGIIGSEQFWEKYKSKSGTLISNEKGEVKKKALGPL